MTTRRLDPLSLIFGLLFLGAAGLALAQRPITVELPWLLAAGLTALGLWLVASALPARHGDEAGDPS